MHTFLNDARALASPHLTLLLAGNKADLSEASQTYEPSLLDGSLPKTSSYDSRRLYSSSDGGGSVTSSKGLGLGAQNSATVAPEGREVSQEEAARWASSLDIPVSVEVSALSGDNVEELFSRLARMILTKIELGEIDPDDPYSGIQYGDSMMWAGGASDVGSVKSGMTVEDAVVRRRGRGGKGRKGTGGWGSGMREWEDVFRLNVGRRRTGGCC